MSDYIIETHGVSRAFEGRTAVHDLNLRVPRGCIYGFLGRNGAGKTTTIKMLVGLIKPDAGEIRINGVNPWQFTVEDRWKVGYLSEKQTLMPNIRIDALIKFTANFYPQWDFALCERILKRFKLDPAKRIRELSQGGARQIGFLLALAQKPDLLILDEPAATLDVVARRDFLEEVLGLLREEGKTVLFSSHILSDVERIADEIGIMANGTLKLSEPLDNLKETVKQVRFFNFAKGINGFTVTNAFQFKQDNREAVATFRLSDENAAGKIALAHQCEYEIRDLSLEDIFIEIVKDN